ncbi:MAG: hypothetical protein WCO55_02900 [Candidatus Falkowbacteria bacterium]
MNTVIKDFFTKIVIAIIAVGLCAGVYLYADYLMLTEGYNQLPSQIKMVIVFVDMILLLTLAITALLQVIFAFKILIDEQDKMPWQVRPIPSKNNTPGWNKEYRQQKNALQRRLEQPEEFKSIATTTEWFFPPLKHFNFTDSELKKFVDTPDSQLQSNPPEQIEKYAWELFKQYNRLDNIAKIFPRLEAEQQEYQKRLIAHTKANLQVQPPWLRRLHLRTLGYAENLLRIIEPRLEDLPPYSDGWEKYKEEDRRNFGYFLGYLDWIIDDTYNGALSWYNQKLKTEKLLAAFNGWPTYKFTLQNQWDKLQKEIDDFALLDSTEEPDYWHKIKHLLKDQDDAFCDIEQIIEDCQDKEKDLLNGWFELKSKLNKPGAPAEKDWSKLEKEITGDLNELQILAVMKILFKTNEDISQSILSDTPNWQLIKYQLEGIEKLIPDEETCDIEL